MKQCKNKLYILRKFYNRDDEMKALTEAQKKLYGHVRSEVEEAYIQQKRKLKIQ